MFNVAVQSLAIWGRTLWKQYRIKFKWALSSWVVDVGAWWHCDFFTLILQWCFNELFFIVVDSWYLNWMYFVMQMIDTLFFAGIPYLICSFMKTTYEEASKYAIYTSWMENRIKLSRVNCRAFMLEEIYVVLPKANLQKRISLGQLGCGLFQVAVKPPVCVVGIMHLCY